MKQGQMLAKLAVIIVAVMLIWALTGDSAVAQDSANNKKTDKNLGGKNASTVFESNKPKEEDGKGPNKKQLIFTGISFVAAIGVFKFL